MVALRRFVSLKLDASAVARVDGPMRIPAALTRTGIFEYATPSGKTIREYRAPEEVFAPESLESLRGVPVTEMHPPEQVSPSNWKALAIGHVGDDVQTSGDLVCAHVYVNDSTAIQKISKKNLQEVSLGYFAEVVDAPGVTPDGEPYDAVQRNIRYNHAALGPQMWGRAGGRVRLLLDSNGHQHPEDLDMEKENQTVALIKDAPESSPADGPESAVAPDQGSEGMDVADKDSDAAEANVVALLTKADAILTKLDELGVKLSILDRLDQLEGKLAPPPALEVKTDSVDFKALALYRADCLDLARRAGVEVKNEDTETAILSSVASSLGVKTDGWSDDRLMGFLQARLDGAGRAPFRMQDVKTDAAPVSTTLASIYR